MVQIKEVKTKQDLKRFIKFPYSIYSDNPNWIPPLQFDELNTLRWDKNPAFDYCEAKYWLAYKDGKIAGRIAGIISHKYIEKWGAKNARFGWVDFIDDEEVSKALFETVENWAREKGMEGLHGPLGFCDLDKEGMLIEGFDKKSMFITIYNYPYYPAHLEKMGYAKDVDWVEFELKTPEQIPEKVERINNVVLKRLKLRIYDAKKAKELLPYADGIFDLLNDAYKNLYGVVPLSDKQIKMYTKQYLGFLNPEYVKIILDEENKVAAFGICAPSLAEAAKKANGKLFPFGFIYLLRALKRSTRLDFYLVAVRPELQAKGITALLMTEITKAAIKNGVRTAETGPELEENDKVQALWKHYDTRQHKRRRSYIKKL
ncbi:MAG: hypothetical protein Q8920_15775 [Bacillota bacterium]|nr:hypothetical protein [Bacillota bacterium]